MSRHRRHPNMSLPGFLVFICLALPVKAIKILLRYRRNLKLSSIDKMTGLEFERCVATALGRQGYKKVKFTERYDYGIDIVANKNGIRWGIQVKRHGGLVKANAVRQAVTALKKYNCTRAMVVSNSYFSKYAAELAKCNDCVLVNRRTLAKWL